MFTYMAELRAKRDPLSSFTNDDYMMLVRLLQRGSFGEARGGRTDEEYTDKRAVRLSHFAFALPAASIVESEATFIHCP